MPGRRIVLIDMATEDAEAFVRKAVEHGGILTQTDDDEPYNLPAKVEAVVARPTVWCKCNVQPESKYQRRKRQARREGGWSRGSRFGWWLCAHCRRPSRAAVVHWIDSMLVGANDLLPEILGGERLTAMDRWRLRGGVINEHANANPHSPGRVKAMDGEMTKERKRVRRSEVARQESRFTSTGDDRNG